MNFKATPIQPPSRKEKIALRAMIFIGFFSAGFFLYNMFLPANMGFKPLYILLMITMVYYSLKYMHEWYHYFSISVTPRPAPTKNYTVDVFTTYCAGEPFDMLEQTLTAMQAMKYPHTTYCCDEADDPDVKALCQHLGVKHVTRTVKVNAKAGNINNALKQATGELCVVMDPDHIPAPDFLDAVVGYFEDPNVGYVQIVQAYYNQRESMVAKGAAQQTYQFYGPMMMCMNTYGTVQAIGANCTFRRAALDSIGGHAAGLSEDMHTAMQMHAKGWKSVYLPSILTRGLVPATMSSYFKQQLKWSRGTWELLLATYPRLFPKFTWRQRIHYFLLPFHYLSGIIFFINFLIPVISLFTGYIPLKMDVIGFAMASFPMLAMSVLVRHYVQKWVAEENERGFHIVGGILQIGAWWVHSIGFIYTLLRKKVPYIPTPKNDSDPLPFILSIPNLCIAAVSVVAIVYGFVYNYNPYTTFMAVLAAMQVAFMVIFFAISGYAPQQSKATDLAMRIRKKTWLIIQTHGFLRKYSVPLSVIVVTVFIFGYRQMTKLPTFLPKPLPGLDVFYKGVSPDAGNSGLEQALAADASIIALRIAPDSSGNTYLPIKTVEDIYKKNALPLIEWAPLEKNNIPDSATDKLMLEITEGRHDGPLLSFAKQVALLDKPLFIKPFLLPNEANTPDKASPENFIAAWRHVYKVFESAGVAKAVWVWQAWNTTSSPDYFPGSYYADWLGTSIADSIKEDISSGNQGFYSLYQPYHKLTLFNYGIPVMITSASTAANNKKAWWAAAENNIDTAFKEIRAVVIKKETPVSFAAIFNKRGKSNFERDIPPVQLVAPSGPSRQYALPDTMRAIVYDKGFFWFRNRHTMTKRSLDFDIRAMKYIGINTVERSMPGFYDDVIDELLRKYEIKQIARFATNIGASELEDDKAMEKEKEKILGVVRNNANKTNIIAWNLGTDVLYNLENQTYRPDYFYYRNKYINWLNNLCKSIRAIDSRRPIITDLNWDANGKKRLQFYEEHVPVIDKYLLTATLKNKAGLKSPITGKMAWGKVPVELWDSLPTIKRSGFVPAWQDIENTDYISLNGILDLEGRRKNHYYKVAGMWAGKKLQEPQIPDVKILKPAKTTRENTELKYQVMYRQDTTQWKLYDKKIKDVWFEWYLVRVDQYNNTMFIKKAGEGSTLTLTVPKEPQYYRLLLEAVLSNSDCKVSMTTLNTPLE